MADEAITKMDGFYEEAVRRLPLREVPDLRRCLNAGGLFFGLADPVSNIILNSIGLLLHDQAKHPPPPPYHQYPPSPEEHRLLVPKCLYASHVLMAAYFRNLSGAQATRYLSLASYDLLLAIKLVHHDCLAATAAGRLLPDGGRLRAALRVAATKAGHPAPDVVARLMTAAYPHELLSRVLAMLRGTTEPLSAHDVIEIKHLLACQPSTPEVSMEFWCRPDDDGDRASTCTRDDGDAGTLRLVTRIGEDVVAHISIVRSKDHHHSSQSYIPDLTFSAADLEAKLSIYSMCVEAAMRAVPRSHLQTAVAVSPQIQRERLKEESDASISEDMVSLKLRLLDTIHAFYIKALSILPVPSTSRRLLLRALVQAGHCYGPWDPVSNIIINSVWYSKAFLSAHEKEEDAADAQLPECSSIDARLLARLGSRSLDGLVAVVGSSSQHRALEILADYNCQPPKHHDGMESRYHRAAQVSKHPQAAAFCSFLSCVFPAPGDCLQRLLPPPGKRFSDANWDELNAMIAGMAVPAPEKEPPCSLLTAAPVEISKGKCDFRRQNNLHPFGFGASLNGLLRKYCYQHPWEPSFKLDIICGVWRSKFSSVFRTVPNFYHVNFLAITNDAAAKDERTLFFAELRDFDDAGKPSFCCPVNDYCHYTGRCSFCEEEGSKIVHPPSGGHYGDFDGSTNLLGHHNLRVFDYEGLLDADYVDYSGPDDCGERPNIDRWPENLAPLRPIRSLPTNIAWPALIS